MIPPALVEVWQPVAESQLQEFEYNRANPAYLCVSNDQNFKPPSKEMSEKMHIINIVPKVRNWIQILWGVQSAVGCIVLLWQVHSKLCIIVFEELPCFLQRQESKVDHKEPVYE